MLEGMDNDFQWHTRPNDLSVCACVYVSIIVLYGKVVK